ncbi:hypothetical protein D3C81_2049020 [compost metagenome]
MADDERENLIVIQRRPIQLRTMGPTESASIHTGGQFDSNPLITQAAFTRHVSNDRLSPAVVLAPNTTHVGEGVQRQT